METKVVKVKKQPGKKGANKLKRVGCRKAIIAAYYGRVYPVHKLRRILRNNGEAAAQAWADKHICLSIFERLRGHCEP